jgi:hypothetical protein
LAPKVILVEQDLVGTAQRIFAERGLTLLHPFDDPPWSPDTRASGWNSSKTCPTSISLSSRLVAVA